MKTLVTGSAGFIGSRVVRRLLARGHDVRAMVLPRENRKNLQRLDVEIVEGDTTDVASVERAVRGVEVVYHLAAIYALWLPRPERMREVNVDGTRNVLRAARRAGVRRVVYTSSIARFGGQGLKRRASEESPFALGPTGNLYAQTKADAHEVACGEVGDGMDIVIVAPTGPIGPGDIGPTPTGKLLLASFMLPLIVAVPTVTNFAHVDDIAEGHVLAAERGINGRSYLLGNQDLTMSELARMVAEQTGKRRRVLNVSYAAATAVGHLALKTSQILTRKPPLLTPDSVRIARLGLAADCTRAVRELGMPQTPISKAVADAYEYWRSIGYLDKTMLQRLIPATER